MQEDKRMESIDPPVCYRRFVETAASADEIEFILKALPLRGLSEAAKEIHLSVGWRGWLASLQSASFWAGRLKSHRLTNGRGLIANKGKSISNAGP